MRPRFCEGPCGARYSWTAAAEATARSGRRVAVAAPRAPSASKTYGCLRRERSSLCTAFSASGPAACMSSRCEENTRQASFLSCSSTRCAKRHARQLSL